MSSKKLCNSIMTKTKRDRERESHPRSTYLQNIGAFTFCGFYERGRNILSLLSLFVVIFVVVKWLIKKRKEIIQIKIKTRFLNDI